MAELVWEGKYRADGKRVRPVRVALPFQMAETVNESAQERDWSLTKTSSQTLKSGGGVAEDLD